MATVCPKKEPWRFTRRSERMTESIWLRSMVDILPRCGSLSARCRYCTKMLNGATASRDPAYDTKENSDGTATTHQRPDDRDPRPAPDVQVAQVGGRSGPRRRPQRRQRRDLRLPRPERGRQDDDAADARDAPHADARARRPSPAPTCAREPQQVRERIGYVPQGGSTDPAETGRGELVIQGRLYGMNKATRTGARGRGARGARSRGRRRPDDRAPTRAA